MNDGYKRLSQIGLEVYDCALQIFEACGAADDFCHQTGLVFGGTNRIVLTPKGWRAEKAHCSARFLEAFDKFMEVKR